MSDLLLSQPDWCLWLETPLSHTAYMRRYLHNYQREAWPELVANGRQCDSPGWLMGWQAIWVVVEGWRGCLSRWDQKLKKWYFWPLLSWSPSVAQSAWALQTLPHSWVRLSSTILLHGLDFSALFPFCFYTHLVCQGFATEHIYFENVFFFQSTWASPPSLARCRDHILHYMGFLLFCCLLRSVE